MNGCQALAKVLRPQETRECTVREEINYSERSLEGNLKNQDK